MNDGECRNCGAVLQGRFCHRCGQRATPPHLTVHDLLHEATHEFLHLDGKIVQTLKLLALRPGALTREFLAGRRARYISPIRVYLTCSILFFALAAALPQTRSAFITIKATPDAPADSAEERDPGRLEHRLSSAARTAAARGDELVTDILHWAPRVAFVLMPFFALLTWLFYRRAQPFYVPHLYFSIHFHAFVFLVLSIYVLIAALGQKGKSAASLLFGVTVFPYHYVALRRVFGGTRFQTFLRGTAIGILYWVAIGLAMALLLIVLLASLEA